jgi:hypothetical protein
MQDYNSILLSPNAYYGALFAAIGTSLVDAVVGIIAQRRPSMPLR